MDKTQNNMHILDICCLNNKATDGQTDIKHDKAKTLSSMALSVDRVEICFPPHRDRVGKIIYTDCKIPEDCFLPEFCILLYGYGALLKYFCLGGCGGVPRALFVCVCFLNIFLYFLFSCVVE